MDRRVFFGIAAAGVLAAAGAFVGGEFAGGAFRTPSATPFRRGALRSSAAASRPTPATALAPITLPPHFSTPTLTRVAIPHGSITRLPGAGKLVALTVDDGASSEVVALYAEFARRSGMRLTFFLNGSRPSWTENAAALRPLVDSGQVQLGNHTWSHPNLLKLTNSGIAQELTRNDAFISDHYGVSAKPYFRPPFGYHDARVDGIAASIGYTVPTLWFGTLSDSALLTEAQLKGFADKWMLAQHIVIGHANFPTVTRCFDYLAELIHARELQPVTLNDVFAR